LASVKNGKLSLTKRGREALKSPAADGLQQIWNGWKTTKLIDEFRRIDAIKGQSGKGKRGFTDPAYRRYAIAATLDHCPIGEWISLDELSRFALARDLGFEIHDSPHDLYIAEARYGNLGYQGSSSWNILQKRYLLCFLFEYAAPLGIIDIAYERPEESRIDYSDLWGADELRYLSQYDGLQYLRLTPLGAYIIGKADHYSRSTETTNTRISLLPNLNIQVTKGSFSVAEELLIQHFASPVEQGLWQICEDKTRRAIESGADLDQFVNLLSDHDPQPIPETVIGKLESIRIRARACRIKETTYLIECASTEIAETILSNTHTKHFCQRTGKQSLVIPTAKEDLFRKAINSIGYGMPEK
jgi:hypothetical protein